MPHPTAPHGDERLSSRPTQRTPGVPGDDPHPGFAGSRLIDDPMDRTLRPASMPEPPRGLEPGEASLPRGAGHAWQAEGHIPGPRTGGERAPAGRGDIGRAARNDGNTVDGPARS